MLEAKSCVLHSSACTVEVPAGAARRWGLVGVGDAGIPVTSGADSALAAAVMRILCSGSGALGGPACLTGVLGCVGLLAAAAADAAAATDDAAVEAGAAAAFAGDAATEAEAADFAFVAILTAPEGLADGGLGALDETDTLCPVLPAAAPRWAMLLQFEQNYSASFQSAAAFNGAASNTPKLASCDCFVCKAHFTCCQGSRPFLPGSHPKRSGRSS